MHNSLHLEVAYTQQPPDKPMIAQENHLPVRQERTGDCQGGIVVQGVAAAATFTHATPNQNHNSFSIPCLLINHLLMAQMVLLCWQLNAYCTTRLGWG